MERIETSLPGVLILQPRVYGDERGFFMETYNQNVFADLGIDSRFIQDNHSKSKRGTLRGMHYQLQSPQAKLCRVIQGEVLDVAIDIRHGSPNFGKYTAVVLSAENKRQLFVPRGFAHGFLVLSETAEFLYKCDDSYRPNDEYGVAWNDPHIGIDWGTQQPLLSEKDSVQPLLSTIPPGRLPAYMGS